MVTNIFSDAKLERPTAGENRNWITKKGGSVVRVHQLSVISLAIVASIGMSACKKAPPAAQPTPVPAATQDNRAQAIADSIARAQAAERDRLARERAEAERLRREAALRDSLNAARSALSATIHFDFALADIRASDRALLDQKVEIMKRLPAVRLRAEGNADDRGSDEFNFALGMRRAGVVKAYLVERGVDPSRIEIISYGEERKTCSVMEESCWAANRRAEFVITAGGQ